MKVDFEILTGRCQKHLNKWQGHLFHREALSSLKKLKEKAHKAGFDMAWASSFRSFEKQLLIWNNKASGQRALLDTAGRPLNFNELTSEQVLLSILRWSALPGASRHHWGTDFDVYDKNSLPSPDYQIALTPKEVAPNGPMGKFHAWLDEQIENNKSFGIYRPYTDDRGGVAPERWHLSYAPLACEFLEQYTFEIFLKNIILSDLVNKELVLDHALKIYVEYVINIELP